MCAARCAILSVLLASCGSRDTATTPTPPDGTRAEGRDAGATLKGPARLWQREPGSVGEMLIAEGKGDSVALAVTSDGLAAVTPSGKAIRVLVPGEVSFVQYDPSWGFVTFVRNDRLEVVDLAATSSDPIVLVDGMPGLDYTFVSDVEAEGAICLSACVLIGIGAEPRVAVATDRVDGLTSKDEEQRYRRDLLAARKAKPVLSEPGSRWLAGLSQRKRRNGVPTIELGPEQWPAPALTNCRVGPSDCGKGFRLGDKVLVVVGQRCDCAQDDCRALCVLHDAATKLFASPSRPNAWGDKANPEANCHVMMDATSRNYILEDGRSICTPTGCTAIGGDVLGWLDPGPIPLPVAEDLSSCGE